MTERALLLDLADRAHRAGAWSGPSLLETLDGVTASMAARHPIEGAHSIWELVEHMASWYVIVAQRMAGRTPAITAVLNFPLVDRRTPEAWKSTLRRLSRAYSMFRAAIMRFPASMLLHKRPKTDHTWGVLIHGQIQHCLYHAGQIALLRRAMGKPVMH